MNSNLIIIAQHNDFTHHVIRCSSSDETWYHTERLKKDSSVLSIELINAQTLSRWDNPAPDGWSWVDEEEL